jgi:peptidoglycan hydrolase CwlO-like protein
MQPSFAVAEQSRALKARSMLQAALEDSHVAAMHLAGSRASAQRLAPEISALEKQVQDLAQQLESKRLLLARSEAEIHELEARIARNEANKPGLCIR